MGPHRDVAGDPGAARGHQAEVPGGTDHGQLRLDRDRPGPSPCATPTCSRIPEAWAIRSPASGPRWRTMASSYRQRSAHERLLRASRRDERGPAPGLVPHGGPGRDGTTRGTSPSWGARRRSSAPEGRPSLRSRWRRHWPAIRASPTWPSSASRTPDGARWCAPSSCSARVRRPRLEELRDHIGDRLAPLQAPA